MDRIAKIGDTIVQTAFYLLFALTPLVMTHINYELFEYNKMMFVYLISGAVFFGWILRSIGKGHITFRKTPLDIPILLFLLSQLISSIFSMDPHVSWFGYYSRFNGGMMSLLSYALLYFAFGSVFFDPSSTAEKNKNKITSLLKTTLGASALVGAYGIAQRLGIDKHMWVQDVQNRIFSTLGQPNWLAAYVITLSPIAWAFSLGKIEEKTQKKHSPNLLISAIWITYSIILFIILLFTRSRSGLLAFGIMDIFFWAILLYKKIIPIKPIPFVPMLLHGAFIVIVMVNGIHIESVDRYITITSLIQKLNNKTTQTVPQQKPTEQQTQGPLLETGGTESGKIRKFVWQAAIDVWKTSGKTLLIGTGTESFAFAFYLKKPLGHNLTSEWDFLYNKAHNEYLNYLATTGIIGLGTYIMFLIYYIFWYIRSILLKRESHTTTIWNTAIFCGWISILITNFFGFSVVIMQIFLFLLPMLAFALTQINHIPTMYKKFTLNTTTVWAIVLPSSIAAIMLITRLIITWDADRIFTIGYRFARLGQYAQAFPAMRDAVEKNPGEPLFRDERANLLTSISMTALENGQTTLSAQLAQEAVAENETAISISPNNVNFWKTRTKILYALSAIDAGYLESAIAALEHAGMLSPNDPKIVYNLGVLYAQAGNGPKTVELMEKAIMLKPDYHDAYKGLYIFFTEIKQPQKAQAYLQEYLKKIDPTDIEFNQVLQGNK